tara:strand:- start:46982 stop:47905 length:924 start_codon:yes stop_codon:yes gene_type:complete
MTDPRLIEDVEESLRGLLVDSSMLSGDSAQCKTEVGKRALDIGYGFESNPRKITCGVMEMLTKSEGSQIGNPDNYLAHIFNTAGVFKGLVVALKEAHPDLDLPHPDVAHAMGLVHDLNATFSDYLLGGQQSKEIDLFLLAKLLGWRFIEEQVAMHSDYIGEARLMAEGVVDFPKKEAYGGMIRIFQGDGPVSYGAIEKQFAEFLRGEDNLPLMTLTIADYMAPDSSGPGSSDFDGESLRGGFKARSGDILFRYHGKPIADGKMPSLLGQALADGGMDRITGYRNTMAALLGDNSEKVERLRAGKLFQ